MIRARGSESQIFELAANQDHAEPVGHGRVNVERFARDALLLFGIEELQRAHVVQAVGQLDHHDAHIVDHGEQHLADVLGLPRFRSEKIEPADFRGAFHQARYVSAEYFVNLRERNFGVFDDVMQQRGAQRGDVKPHIREKVCHFHGMREERLARKPRLRLVLLGGEIESAAKKLEVVTRAVPADLVHQLDEAKIDGTPCGWRNRRFRGWFHSVCPLNLGLF